MVWKCPLYSRTWLLVCLRSHSCKGTDTKSSTRRPLHQFVTIPSPRLAALQRKTNHYISQEPPCCPHSAPVTTLIRPRISSLRQTYPRRFTRASQLGASFPSSPHCIASRQPVASLNSFTHLFWVCSPAFVFHSSPQRIWDGVCHIPRAAGVPPCNQQDSCGTQPHAKFIFKCRVKL